MIAGLAAGVTEAVAVVTPMEVIKIRLQAQHHSMADPLDIPKYRNAAHATYTLVKEEGFGALYRGISLTALRQGLSPIPFLILPLSASPPLTPLPHFSYPPFPAKANNLAHRIQPSSQLHRLHGI
jgi:hypothetical protein